MGEVLLMWSGWGLPWLKATGGMALWQKATGG